MPVAATATAMLCSEIIFPMTPPGRVGRRGQNRADAEAVRGDDLQVAEQRTRRGHAARQDHAEPAEQRR